MHPKQAKIYEFRCDQCGASVHYQAGKHALHCQSCGWHTPITHADHTTNAPLALREQSLDAAIANIQRQPLTAPNAKTAIDCTRCGASFIWQQNEIAGRCPYCKSPIAKMDITQQTLHIDGLIPFVVGQHDTDRLFAQWLKKRWFAPAALKGLTGHAKQFNGVYLPYWTFDTLANVQYHGERGKIIRETRKKANSQTEVYTRTIWRPVTGKLRCFFDDVLVYASKTFPKLIIRKLRPWHLAQVKPYTAAYLAGHQAEHYQLDIGTALSEAKVAIEQQIVQQIYRDIGGDRQRIQSKQIHYQQSTYKILLLPVWYSGFEYAGKNYVVVINGQTGKVSGTYPKSLPKIIAAVGLGAIGLSLAVYFISQYQA
ncbi:hypothetical protein [Ostreibacterium oceani]|uniref:Primosomal protein N' (Replication factor Y)-superfamily II helicase n=1 Tax=Ostreibacterium oceani TaxID=2654998 RepID=A0A6N7EWW3_9GAMM|nr:hypothetical protein [Ostreibacterium oceani]MPV86413.1 hypothetical protein [Ostreibacterium oceani]